ncbi:hypothetical protein [Curtobacterium sp. MCJR17_020]|uniref:hypothetical protein n=1 Tax=Curtobacterium sp. MCJR17_020 TaxID=2175619 RepID=UPI0011B3FFB6|nr:hypothetical protein [Curtobacterium sp. MCJR17_020]WIE72358.1 hypothetical protein DEJ14_000965 [Curtobacterium sp. MCJR17_020]
MSAILLTAAAFLGLGATAWTAIGALATAGTFLIALAAAWIALRQVKQARELAEEQARPYVVAYIEERPESSKMLSLVLRNIGHTAARKLQVSVDPPFVRAREDVGGHHFMDAVFLQETTDVLAPQAELSNFLDSGPERYATDLPGAFSVKLRYEDRAGAELTDEYKLDFTAGRGDLRPEIHGLHHIAKTLRAIAKKQGITHF